MADSEVTICNIAIGWLGGTPFISFNDDSDEAKLCRANYPLLRDAVLVEREWTFAINRIQPAQLQEGPLYGFDKAFQIPPSTLRVVQVSQASSEVTQGSISNTGVRSSARGGTGIGRETRIEWLREGDRIMANSSEQIFARVIERIEDTTKFSPAFDQALAARIAMDLAIPLTNSPKLQQQMAQFYAEKIAMAASSDGMQGRSYNIRSDSLTVVR